MVVDGALLLPVGFLVFEAAMEVLRSWSMVRLCRLNSDVAMVWVLCVRRIVVCVVVVVGRISCILERKQPLFGGVRRS